MTIDAIESAVNRLHRWVVRTPLVQSEALSRRCGLEFLLKLENQQHTGSFKVRGAFNKVLSLDAELRLKGIIAASSGNHGAAVAWCARELGIPATVFVPEGASAAKVEKIRSFGATLRFHGTDGLDTELFARSEADSQGMAYVAPYNDEVVIAGQATVGVEMLEQNAQLDAVFVAVGGGGLIGGMGTWLRHRAPGVRIIGVLPANSPVMAESIRAGRIVDIPTQPTISDGTAGGIESDSVTFGICRDVVDEWVLVSEGTIAQTLREFVVAHDMPIEGAAAVAVAGAVEYAPSLKGGRVAAVICGGNIASDRLAAVMEGSGSA